MAERLSVSNQGVRKQSASGPPEMNMVKVAVMPPRLPPGMAPPTGVGVADAFSWDEAVNWQHNDVVQDKGVSKGKSFLKTIGLTAQRQRANKDLPPFTFRTVPYDVWRMHYAKDADGNYHGTHAPAQDCILKPDDVAKWRLEEPKTQGDRYTRGSEALPVYVEVQGQERVPEYGQFEPPPGEPLVDAKVANAPALQSNGSAIDQQTGELIADGKTAQEIIAEAKAKAASPEAKKSWKQRMQHATEIALMGS